MISKWYDKNYLELVNKKTINYPDNYESMINTVFIVMVNNIYHLEYMK